MTHSMFIHKKFMAVRMYLAQKNIANRQEGTPSLRMYSYHLTTHTPNANAIKYRINNSINKKMVKQLSDKKIIIQMLYKNSNDSCYERDIFA